MIRVFSNLPRHVLISLAVIAGALVVLAILLPLLGGASDDAFAENAKLNTEVTRVTKAIADAKVDVDYVNAHKDEFAALLQSDRLVPHTRRAATVELENVAHAEGLTTLSYSIAAVAANAPAAAQAQPTSNGYRLSVENITLKVGAPLDGAIYRFLTDISDSFPGSAIVQSFTLSRASRVTAAELAAVSSGESGASLVNGEVVVSWRTAQAQDKDAK